MLLPLLGGTMACKQLEDPPPPPFKVAVRVDSDENVPLANASIQRSSKELGKTDETGKAILTFHGSEGDQLEVWVKCPDGYLSPVRPITVKLHRFADGKITQYEAACPPTERKVVVAVRSDHGYDLPIKYLGNEIARTDSAGAATFMMKAKPGDQLEFLLDTSDKSAKNLRPESPTVSVVVQPRDEYYMVDQPFKVQHKKVIYVRRHGPVAIGPTRLR